MWTQVYVNNHLQIATTCLQRPLFWFLMSYWPLNNDHVPVNYGHYLRVVLVHRFGSTLMNNRQHFVLENQYELNLFHLSMNKFLLCFIPYIFLHLSGENTALSRAAICQLDSDPGPCEGGDLKRWYFNNQRQTCVPFIYSGCAGNRWD